MLRFSYQAEKFSVARGILMAPHPHGEDSSFADAFRECSLGLHQFDINRVEYEEARRWIATIQRTMDTTGLSDPKGVGTYRVKASGLSIEEKYEFSRAVDELAHYFDREFWSPDTEGTEDD